MNTIVLSSSVNSLFRIFFVGVTIAGGAIIKANAGCEDLYATRVTQAVRASIMSDGAREEHLFQNLGYQHGPRAQVLRVLWWGTETIPLLRKELIRQWINDSRPEPTLDEIMAKFTGMVTNFSPEAKAARQSEIEEVLAKFQENPTEMRSMRNAECWVPGVVGIPVLDNIDEDVLFTPGSPQWREMIHRLPETVPSEGGDDTNGAVYIHLWVVSPPLDDADLQKKLVDQALSTYPASDHHRLYPWVMENRLDELPAATKSARINLLHSAQGKSEQ